MKTAALAILLLFLISLGCSSGRRSSRSYSVSYEVIGDPPAIVSVTYENETGGTEQANVTTPWVKRFIAHNGDSLYVSAQIRDEYGYSITITSAKLVEFQIFDYEYKLSPKQLTKLKQLSDLTQ